MPWDDDTLTAIADTDDLHVAPFREDGTTYGTPTWIWSVVVAGGSKQWRTEPPLVRTFGWLTVLWAGIYILKTVVQTALYLADQATALGVVRIVFGYPPYLLLLALTVWAVRRTRERAAA